jgi:D-specific alpha-keto acid dehydrogenase
MTKTALTFYGCDQGEAVLLRDLVCRLGVMCTITDEPLSEANVGMASGTRCISISHKTQVTHSMLRALERAGVKYISTRSVGYNHIDVDYAESIGITIENVAYSPDSVADYTLMFILMIVRDAKSTLRRISTHDFRLSDEPGRELRDMTVGVVGMGRIGTAVINRLKGFGCRVLAYDHRPKVFVDYVPLEELLGQSDIVTLHTPLSADTHHLLNQESFARMKDGAIVINTGRGALIDTRALVAALQCGKLGGVALDVIEGEEDIFYSDHSNEPLRDGLLRTLEEMPNVTITPHTAYYTDHALYDMVENSVVNCLKFERKTRNE